jgi:hypothetical protein
MRWNSSVAVVTRYGLDGPVIESRDADISRTRLDRQLGPLSYLYNGYWVVQRQQSSVDHTFQFIVKVKEGLSYTATLPLGLHGVFSALPISFTAGSVVFADMPTSNHVTDSSKSAVFVSVEIQIGLRKQGNKEA